MDARILIASMIATAACGDAEVELAIELVPGQLVVAVSTVDGRAKAHVVEYAPGEPLRVPSDADEAIYTWVIDKEDFVTDVGEPLSSAALAAVAVRVADESATENGACARCLVPSSRTPQVVSGGDRCPVPAWNAGAIWRPSDAAYSCAGATDSRLCTEGSSDDAVAIEVQRQNTFLEWPGSCACDGAEAARNLSTLSIKSITPIDAPWPLSAFASRDDGLIAGFSRHGAAVWSPSTGQSKFTRFVDLDVDVKVAIALPGGDFLVAAEELNTAFITSFRYYRVPIVGDEAQGPVELDVSSQALASHLQYVEGADESPLYILGGLQQLASVEPGAFACTAGAERCQKVNFLACEDERRASRLRHIEMMPDGVGVGLSDRGLFYKAANEPPLVNPHPSDTWQCQQFKEDVPTRDGSSEVEVGAMRSMARIGNRVFVCARGESTERCQPGRAVVLTATVSAPFGEYPTPDWEVSWEGSPGSSCRSFLPSNASGIVRLQLGGLWLVELDERGDEVASMSARDVYGSFERMGDLHVLDDETLLSRGGENQVYVNTGTTSFERVYGPETLGGASFRAIAIAPNDDFYVFGDPRGIVRVSGGEPTLIETAVLADVRVDGAAIDGSQTTGDRLVFLVGGAKDSKGHLVRVQVAGDAVTVDPPLDLPTSFDSNLEVVDLAETSPGRFVAVMQGTKILRVDGVTVTEVIVNPDDPATEAVEMLHRNSPDACSGNTPRLDSWRRVIGVGGVAWAAGLHGLLVRVVDDSTERFVMPHPIELSAIRGECADRIVVGGRGTAGQLDEPNTNVAFYETLPRGPTSDPEEVQIGARPIEVVRIAEDELFTLGLGEVQYAKPLALFADRTANRSDETRAIGVALDNGFVYRLEASEPIGYLRAPFSPRRMAQASDGTVLFVGSQGRIAVGTP